MDSVAAIRVDDQSAPGSPRLVLRGRVTVGHVDELHRAAVSLSQRGRDVTVDCETAEYLDTSVIQLLIALRRELAQGGHSCEVVGATAALREDFRLTGFAGGAA